MIVGVPKETFAGETRVAITPMAGAALVKSKLQVLIENGAGASAGFEDTAYTAKGASSPTAGKCSRSADILLQVRTSPPADEHDYASLKPDCLLIGFCDPLGSPGEIAEIAAKGVSLISMEMIPRITRAQAMDALSSQANLAGI